MGGEGVAEGVGADVVLGAGFEHVAVDDAADAAGGEGAAAVVEEETAGVFFVGALFGEEVGAAFVEIGCDGLLGGGAEEDDALAVAFAADEELGGAAGLVDGEADELADAEAGGVEGFENRPVAEPEGGFVVGRGEELLHVALVEELGEAAALAGGGEADGGVGGGCAAGFEVAIKGAEGGELASDGGSGVVLFVEVGEEAPEVGRADVGPGAGEARLLKKGGALLEVVGIGAEGGVGGAAAVLEFGEEGVYGSVHGLMLHRRLLPYPGAGCLRDRVRWEGGETGYISRGFAIGEEARTSGDGSHIGCAGKPLAAAVGVCGAVVSAVAGGDVGGDGVGGGAAARPDAGGGGGGEAEAGRDGEGGAAAVSAVGFRGL